MAQTLNDEHSSTFHPPRITKPRPFIQVTRGLLGIPREIFHQIVDDLTLFEVLQIASCLEDSTYIDQCLLGHPVYQHFFFSQDRLTEVRDLFIVFYELRASLKWWDDLRNSDLAFFLDSPGTFITDRLLIDALKEEISKILSSLTEIRLKTLNEVSDKLQIAEVKPLGSYEYIDHRRPKKRWQVRQPTSCQILYDQWHLLITLEEHVNGNKAAQLTRMAALYEAFPDLLKFSDSTSQKARSNTRFVATELRYWAGKVRQNKWLHHPKGLEGRSFFRYHFLPLVPFDWCLRLFIKHMHTSPPAGFPASMIRENEKGVVKTRKPRKHPASITKDIKTVIAGMSYVYTTAAPRSKRPPPRFMRTKFTPYSVPFQRPYSVDGSQSVGSPTPEVAKEGGLGQKRCWQLLSQQRKLLIRDTEPSKHWKPLYQNTINQEWGEQRRIHPARGVPVTFAQTASPDECWDPSHEHPVFTSPPCKHFGDLHAGKVVDSADPSWDRLMPYDEREFEWLEAFLRAVSFMREMEKRETEKKEWTEECDFE